MKTAKEKITAKVNLTLDITGSEMGFHNLNSLFASINIYDYFTAKKRTDKSITIKFKGIKPNCDYYKSNAYKTAVAFIEKYNTSGADITIKRNIPVGGGFGGSSADSAGVIKVLSRLYGVDDKNGIINLANLSGSDTAFMLNGGIAVCSGRGNIIEKIDGVDKLFLIVCKGYEQVLTKECYAKFDELKVNSSPCTKKAVEYLLNRDNRFFDTIKNDLYIPAISLKEGIKERLDKMNSLLKKGKAVMTGSGSGIVAVFFNKKERNKSYRVLRKNFTELIKAETK